MHPSSNRMVFPMLGRIPPRAKLLFSLLLVVLAIDTCNAECPKGKHQSGNATSPCVPLKTICPGTDKAMYSWMALAGLPVHPHANEPSLTEKANLRQARRLCQRRGYDVIDYSAFTNRTKGVRGCMEALLQKMMASTYGSTIIVWTSHVYRGEHVLFKQDKNNHDEAVFDRAGTTLNDVICEAKWIHAFSSAYVAATPASRRAVTQPFAREACQQYGLNFITVDWLQAHGHVFRERWLQRLPIEHNPHHGTKPFHVEPISADGEHHYRTVTFSSGSHTIHNAPSDEQARILCVKFCENKGVVAANMSCVCNRTTSYGERCEKACDCLNQGHCDDTGKCICPKEFTGNKCQSVVCTNPWVKKNKECECKPRLDGPKCTEVCHCLNHGKCAEDGTCVCQKGFHGDLCQQTFKTKCLGTDNATYTWMALASLPCHPDLDGDSCQKKTNLTHARQMCKRRGYDVVEFHAFTNRSMNVRDCMEALLNEMMESSFKSPITIWTSFLRELRDSTKMHVLYKQGKNGLREEVHDRTGAGHHDVICEAKWLHDNNSAYTVATPASRRIVTEPFAEEACQQYGLQLVTEDWLRAHGDVLRERGLERLALKHERDQGAYHVKAIRVNGGSLYRTVTFSENNQEFHHTRSNDRAQILCVACDCLNQGHCDDKGKCICPKEFTGNKCQSVVCTNPWVKKNKECECKPRLDGPKCTEVCHCLNHGKCAEDGTCVCQKGFHGDLCQQTLKTICPGTDKAMYSWMALAGLPVHPHANEPSLTEKANLTQARRLCQRRGYDVIEYSAFINPTKGVRGCMEALLRKMMASTYGSTITVWTSYVHRGDHVIYKQDKNNHRQAVFDRAGTTLNDVICEAKWLHANNSAYTAATPASRRIVTEPFAEEACQQYGLQLVTEDWLRAHGDVLRERGLERLALKHERDQAAYHVKAIRVDGDSLYRTVTFSENNQEFHHTRSNDRAQILCVACNCLNQGHCDDKGKCICPKEFTGNKCQSVVCTNPWVKKNKECECKPRLDGPNCTEVCHCLNHGKCAEDGTCVCQKGFHGDLCQQTFKTKCLGTDNATYTWMALASLPCHPHLDGDSCQKKTNLTHARQMCKRRGYDVVEFHAFISWALNVRDCMEALLNEMMESSFKSPITIWTSFLRELRDATKTHLLYKQGKNGLREEVHDRTGAGHHDVICEAKWIHAFSSAYVAATPASRRAVTQPFAREACQQYGLNFITVDWLQAHGHVFRERWLQRLPIEHNPHHGTKPFHVEPISADGEHHYRTVTFSSGSHTIHNAPSDEQARILCVKFCENNGVAANMSCVCNRTTSYGERCEKACNCLNQGHCDDKGKCICPKEFTGNKCQLVVCTNPWVKKNKECECKPRLDGPNCTEVCHCLNHGKCAEDGTCVCQKGFHGDLCQQTFKTKCLGTDNATYNWMALASLPCHPHLDGDSCQKKTNLTHARQMCKRRGYDVVEFHAFTNRSLNVRDCMEALLNEMMESSFKSPITIWTSFLRELRDSTKMHVLYKQGKNGLREEVHDRTGAGHHDVICEAKWLHANNSAYTAATPASRRIVTEPFAEEACQQYGLHLITEDWLRAHGHVLRERGLKRLALKHERDQAAYHVKAIRFDGDSLYRTVTFSENNQDFHRTRSNDRAQILCVRCKCLNQGQCDDKGKCTCPKEFTGNKCQTDFDECASAAHNCDSSAACINTLGSFSCACNDGFYGNGISCQGCNFHELNIASVNRTTGQVTCATGYTRVEGNSVATCPKNSATGNWEGVGNCRALCSEPAAITNGVVNPGIQVAVSDSSEKFYSSAVYKCNQGYRLSTGTSNVLSCSVSSDVADFGSIPACQACTVDGSGHNIASVSASGTVTCNDGHYHNGSLPVCQDAFVSWQNIGSCQAVCTHPWVKKNKECECKPKLDGPTCIEVCNCLNHGQCTEDGTCICRKGFHGDQCQHTKWLHANDSVYAAATPALRPRVTERFAEDACQEHGFHLITKDWLQEHGHVLTERWLGTLALLHKHKQAPYHVASIRANGSSLHRTVTFSAQKQTFQNATKKTQAQILCVKTCETGFLGPNLSCVCNRTSTYGQYCEKACKCLNQGRCDNKGECSCPKGFTGDKCQLVVCTHPWVKKNKVCECTARLDGPNCTEAFKTKCLGTDKAMYTWMALAGLPCHPHLDGDSCQKKTNLTRARQMCKRRGYDVVDYNAFTSQTLGVRDCMEELLNKMMASNFNSPITIWTSFLRAGKHVMYKKGKNNLREELHDSSGSSEMMASGHSNPISLSSGQELVKNKLHDSSGASHLDGEMMASGDSNPIILSSGQELVKNKLHDSSGASHLDGEMMASGDSNPIFLSSGQELVKNKLRKELHDSSGASHLEMMASGDSNPISISASLEEDDQNIIYQQGKNELREELYDSNGASHHDVICEAKWLHVNSSVYTTATPALRPYVTEQFAEEACEQYGLHLVTGAWLQAHGHVLIRERFLERLAIRQAPYHVKPIVVNGNSLYRTVTFSEGKQRFVNTTSNHRAQILCVMCKCLNQGQCDDKGKCICPKGFTGDNCQKVVCTHPWVKKNKVCECKARLGETNCTEACNCLNNGQCTEDGTCLCPTGFRGDQCQDTFRTKSLGTDKVMYTWTALAGLPCYSGSCPKITGWTKARDACGDRGYQLVDFKTFTWLGSKLGVRYRVKSLLHEIMASTNSSAITIWTSSEYYRRRIIYKQYKNKSSDTIFSVHGSGHHNVICEGKWRHINDSQYAAATIPQYHCISWQYAENACQQYGLRLITKDWLQEHGHVLRERWLEKLALNKSDGLGYHVAPILVNGQSLYRTVKFSRQHVTFKNETSQENAKILCVKSCGSGVLAPDMRCVCNRTMSYGEECEKACKCLNRGECDDKGECSCPRGFTGRHCQLVVCAKPWVKKSKVCECQPGLDGRNCTEACNCLNDGQCTDDGSCNCQNGFHGDQCQHIFKTKCLGTDNATYTWMALASLPCHPHLDGDSCQKKTNLTHARQMCKRRGYDVVDHNAFTNQTLGVRDCMGALLNKIVTSGYRNPTSIWTSFKKDDQHLIYQQGKNKLPKELYDSDGTSHHDVICEAKWLRYNDSVYAAATPSLKPSVTEQFAEEACQEYGLHLITKDWLHAHGHVLRKRWLDRLALRHASYHVKRIRVNGNSHYRTVTFRNHSNQLQNSTINRHAKILCVKHCANGVLAQDLSCKCNRSVFYGEYCEKDDCKCLNQGQCDNNGKCTCPIRFYGEHCQLECKTCLNQGRCNEDGTCTCAEGWIGDRCQTRCADTDPCCVNKRIVTRRDHVCRAATSDCDVAEYCDGETATCPEDLTARNGWPCSNSQAYCWSGVCQSRTGQCQSVWNDMDQGSAPEDCFTIMNMDGDRIGNCGFKSSNSTPGTYAACAAGDSLCGSLFCLPVARKIQPSSDVLAETIRVPDVGKCNGLYASPPRSHDDPSLVKDGTRCDASGANKDLVCHKQRCVDKSRVTSQCSVDADSGKECGEVGVCTNATTCLYPPTPEINESSTGSANTTQAATPTTSGITKPTSDPATTTPTEVGDEQWSGL
ncbi:uncharacterized protein LOC135821639 [Sycon ciliatum]|uniref:uncharacterized protein LOC135821639 n=2 Tax=Sycon ciliatum TaxID=27933 RepID=UPI0031F62B4B